MTGPAAVQRGGLEGTHPCKEPRLPSHHLTGGAGAEHVLSFWAHQSVQSSVSSDEQCRYMLAFTVGRPLS